MSRIAASGRVACSGRVAASGRVATVGRVGTADWLLLQNGNGMLWSMRPDPGFVTSSSGSVSATADRTGIGDGLVQNSGLSKPTLTASWRNGRPALSFSGSKLMATLGAHCPSESYSFGGVFECTSTAASRCPFALGTIGVPAYTIEDGAHTVRYLGGTNCVDGSSSLTSPIDVVITRDAGVTGITKMYINGVEQPLTPSAVAQGTPSGVLVVGALDTSKTFPFIGNIAEAFILSGVMSLSDVTTRRGYTSGWYSF